MKQRRMPLATPTSLCFFFFAIVLYPFFPFLLGKKKEKNGLKQKKGDKILAGPAAEEDKGTCPCESKAPRVAEPPFLTLFFCRLIPIGSAQLGVSRLFLLRKKRRTKCAVPLVDIAQEVRAFFSPAPNRRLRLALLRPRKRRERNRAQTYLSRTGTGHSTRHRRRATTTKKSGRKNLKGRRKKRVL